MPWFFSYSSENSSLCELWTKTGWVFKTQHTTSWEISGPKFTRYSGLLPLVCCIMKKRCSYYLLIKVSLPHAHLSKSNLFLNAVSSFSLWKPFSSTWLEFFFFISRFLEHFLSIQMSPQLARYWHFGRKTFPSAQLSHTMEIVSLTSLCLLSPCQSLWWPKSPIFPGASKKARLPAFGNHWFTPSNY